MSIAEGGVFGLNSSQVETYAQKSIIMKIWAF